MPEKEGAPVKAQHSNLDQRGGPEYQTAPRERTSMQRITMPKDQSDILDELAPNLKDIIMETTHEVLVKTGFDSTPFEQMSPSDIDMLCERMGFEIKAKLVDYFAGLPPEKLKQHLEIIDQSVQDVKRRFEREREGTQ